MDTCQYFIVYSLCCNNRTRGKQCDKWGGATRGYGMVVYTHGVVNLGGKMATLKANTQGIVRVLTTNALEEHLFI